MKLTSSSLLHLISTPPQIPELWPQGQKPRRVSNDYRSLGFGGSDDLVERVKIRVFNGISQLALGYIRMGAWGCLGELHQVVVE